MSDYYRGHNPEQSVALGKATVAELMVKMDAIENDLDGIFDRALARVGGIEQLKAAANEYGIQHGRPEHMSPATWAAMKAAERAAA